MEREKLEEEKIVYLELLMENGKNDGFYNL